MAVMLVHCLLWLGIMKLVTYCLTVGALPQKHRTKRLNEFFFNVILIINTAFSVNKRIKNSTSLISMENESLC